MIGSGYYYLMTNLLTGLAAKGHDISVAGLGYMGEPHPYPFSIIPTMTAEDATSVIKNLNYLNRENPNTLILVGMDIPYQLRYQREFAELKRKYMGITPMENGPLRTSWAMGLANADWMWFISEMAKQEALKKGLTKVDHLNVGVDTELWHPATSEERKQLRQGMGLEDEFVIMTVADNQERKNLWAGMRIVAELKKLHPERKLKYVMVTKEESPVGWDLRDLAVDENIVAEYLPFQRGVPAKNLWGLYACADAYLQPSKAEGLGLPVLEAMACGVPVVCTDTGAMHELCTDEKTEIHKLRGVLTPSAYSIIDVWGNSRRDFIDIYAGTKNLELVMTSPPDTKLFVESALEYVRSRTWDIAVTQVDNKIREFYNEPSQQAPKEG